MIIGSAPGSVLGISFDGLSISGVVNEFLNVASVFRNDGYRVLFDPGGDITPHAGAPIDPSVLPHWSSCIRAAGSALPNGYNRHVVLEAAQSAVRGTPVTASDRYMDIVRQLADGITATMIRESTRVLIVENGTLPDNPLFTEALYIAIAEYGARFQPGKYVIWRDHDLMWSSEPHRYGAYPYPGVRRPVANPYIHYCVGSEWMRGRFEAWCGVQCHVMSNRFYAPDETRRSNHTPLRVAYGIPAGALLIARCTRVIPAKTIERDFRLLAALRKHLDVFLFVTGPTSEAPDEFKRLQTLATSLGIEDSVIWGNGLLSYNRNHADAATADGRYSVADLLAEAQLSSFLTSYDYEGFGNPPGEAMAMGIPYIATTYELYHDVYGSKGAVAPLLRIDRDSTADAPIPDHFVDWVVRALTDEEYREQIVTRNRALCRRFFSLEALTEQVHQLMSL